MQPLANAHAAIRATRGLLNESVREVRQVTEVKMPAAHVAKQVLFHHLAWFAEAVFVFFETESRLVVLKF